MNIENDVLNTQKINKYLKNKEIFNIELYDELSSTNVVMKNRTDQNEGLVIVANNQTMGIGRLGRKFHSPKNSGIYFSILLKPNIKSDKSIFITPMAGVAVCRAIEKITNKNPKIKWVNDIYLEGKKVCGILSQSSFDFKTKELDYVILGIGINIYTPNDGFNDDIKNIATSVLDDVCCDFKNKLFSEILNEFWCLYEKFDTEKIAKEYKDYSFIIGKKIFVIKQDKTLSATVVDIDNNCNLKVEYENGTEELISTGEISIKLS